MITTTPVRDTADTDTIIQGGRGADLNRTAMQVGTYRVTSPISGRKALRPLGWGVAARYVDTEPRQDISALQPFGALPFYIPPGRLSIGRDESTSPSLDNVQLNTGRNYRGRNGVFLSITAGGAGWKNLSTQATWQNAGAVRTLNTGIASVRVVAQGLMGQRPPVKPDGTIGEVTRLAWTAMIDNAFKRALGMIKGGDFTDPQASVATAVVLSSSQLGQTPKRLDIAYTLQPLGFVSSVNNQLFFSGVISVTA